MWRTRDAIEPAIDKENPALARLAIAAVGFARAEAQADDIAQPAADDALDRLGHAGLADADRIVEIAAHEGQNFGAEIHRIGLVGDAAIVGKRDRPAFIAGSTSRKHDRQQQDRRKFC